MNPENQNEEIENEQDAIFSEAQRIASFFGNFFRFFNEHTHIKIRPSDLVDFILQNDSRKSPMVLCMHVVHILLNSFYNNLSTNQNLTAEQSAFTEELEKSAPPDYLWKFTPDKYYINLALNFIDQLRGKS